MRFWISLAATTLLLPGRIPGSAHFELIEPLWLFSYTRQALDRFRKLE